ncbi:unnamed protein product, partial [Polarella glacialis]
KRRLLSGAVLASALVVSADLVAGAPPRQVFVRQAGAVSPALAMRSRMSLVCRQARSSTALSLVKLPRAAHVRRQSQSRDEDEEAMDQGMDSDDDEDDLPIFDESEWWEAPASWPGEVAQLFLPLGPHSAATDFVQNAPCASAPRARLYNLLCRLPLDDFDLQSVLYPPGSHLLTKSQLQGLFETEGILQSRAFSCRSRDLKATTSVNVIRMEARWKLNRYTWLERTVGKPIVSPTLCPIGRNSFNLHAYFGGSDESKKGTFGLFVSPTGPDSTQFMFELGCISQSTGEEIVCSPPAPRRYQGGKGLLLAHGSDGYGESTGRNFEASFSFETITGSRFVQSDQIVFVLKLQVDIDGVVQPPKETKPPSAFLASWGNLFTEGKHTDVTFSLSAGEATQQLHAHRLVLAANSSVFEQMLFSSGMSEAKPDTEIELADLDARLAQNFIRSFYIDNLDAELWDDDEALCHLMKSFHKFQVKGMLKRCEDCVIKKLSVENVSERLMMADLFDLGSLRESALSFLSASSHRLAEVQSTDGFARLTKQRPHLLADVLATAVQPAKRKSAKLSLEKLPTNLEDLRVVDLKQLLSDRGLSTGGPKAALI